MQSRFLSLQRYCSARNEDDPFFELGNFQRSMVYRIVLAADSKYIEEEKYHLGSILCSVDGCNRTFSSLSSLETHLHSQHIHQCNQCKRSFPSERLLSLHLSEQHDTFFSLLCKKKASFECLVDGCCVVCWTKSDRHQHLVELHKYPAQYDFDAPHQRRKRETLKERSRKQSLLSLRNENQSLYQTPRHIACSIVVNSMDTDDSALHSISESVSRAGAVDEALIATTQEPMLLSSASDSGSCNPANEKKMSLKRVPCRHFVRGYCSRGSACSFLHESGKQQWSQIQSDDTAIEMAVDDDKDVMILATALAEKATVSIPSHISLKKNKKSR